MTKEDDNSNLVSNRLKARRKMLGLNYEDITSDLDISPKEIKHVENLKSPALTSGGKKYLIEITDPEKNRFEVRELDLFEFDGIDLLLEELKGSYDYFIEFCGRIKPGGELYDEFDNVSYEDNNVLEITNIRMVKK